MGRPVVLLIDDEEAFVQGMGEFLENRGFRVESAGKTTAATDLIASHVVDGALVDLNLSHGGEEGFDLVRQLRTARPGARIVLTTALGEDSIPEKALAAGADRFLEKPYGGKRLVALFRELGLEAAG